MVSYVPQFLLAFGTYFFNQIPGYFFMSFSHYCVNEFTLN